MLRGIDICPQLEDSRTEGEGSENLRTSHHKTIAINPHIRKAIALADLMSHPSLDDRRNSPLNPDSVV
jgi:hypothetical protein